MNEIEMAIMFPVGEIDRLAESGLILSVTLESPYFIVDTIRLRVTKRHSPVAVYASERSTVGIKRLDYTRNGVIAPVDTDTRLERGDVIDLVVERRTKNFRANDIVAGLLGRGPT